MNKIEFTDKNGTFRIHNPENYLSLIHISEPTRH